MRAKRKAQAESVAGLLQELQTLNPGIAGDLDRRLQRLPVQRRLHRSDCDAEGHADAGRPDRRRREPRSGQPEFREPDRHAAGRASGTASSSRARRRRSITCSSTRWRPSYVQRYAIARGNADFPEVPARSSPTTRRGPSASSDHDMPVAYFRFPPPSADLRVTMTAGPPTAAAGGAGDATRSPSPTTAPSPAQNVVVTRSAAAGAQPGLVRRDRRRRVRRLRRAARRRRSRRWRLARRDGDDRRRA